MRTDAEERAEAVIALVAATKHLMFVRMTRQNLQLIASEVISDDDAGHLWAILEKVEAKLEVEVGHLTERLVKE